MLRGRYSEPGGMPFLSQLADQGVVLDDFTQCANWTFASTSCALAGRLKWQAGLAPLLTDESAPCPPAPRSSPATCATPAWGRCCHQRSRRSSSSTCVSATVQRWPTSMTNSSGSSRTSRPTTCSTTRWSSCGPTTARHSGSAASSPTPTRCAPRRPTRTPSCGPHHTVPMAIQQPVSAIDLVPTLLELYGLSPGLTTGIPLPAATSDRTRLRWSVARNGTVQAAERDRFKLIFAWSVELRVARGRSASACGRWPHLTAQGCRRGPSATPEDWWRAHHRAW